MAKPKVVVLCGSSRFCDVMAVCAWIIERDELAISMGLHLLPHWYDAELEHHLAEHEGVADAMDELHLRKIDLADEIFVVNVEGYVGSSCAGEIKYAWERGIPIRYFEDDSVSVEVYRRIREAQTIAPAAPSSPAR